MYIDVVATRYNHIDVFRPHLCIIDDDLGIIDVPLRGLSNSISG